MQHKRYKPPPRWLESVILCLLGIYLIGVLIAEDVQMAVRGPIYHRPTMGHF